MIIRALLSSIPQLKRACVITFTPKQVSGENLISADKCIFPRLTTHPRTLAGDFLLMEREVGKVFEELKLGKWLKPRVLVCLDGLNDGGYTGIEKRAFKEACYGAGALAVYLAEQPIAHSVAVRLLIDGRLEGNGVELDR